MRALLFLFAMLAATFGSVAGEIPGPARGLAIYKSRAFRPDSTAVLMEYLSQTNHAMVTYFVPLKGRRITVPGNKAEVLFLPYPGKGEATPEQAFALLEIARTRYPQFEVHYRLYEHAWREEAKRPVEQIHAEIARRTENKKSAVDFATWVRSLFPHLDPPVIPPSPLGPTPLNAPLPTAPEAPAEEPADTENPAQEPDNLAGVLKQLQEFYRFSEQSSNGN